MTIDRVARAMPWSLAARAAAFAAGIVGSMIVVRSLGAVGWGILNEVRTALGFVLVLVLVGTDAAIVKYAPGLRVRGGLPAFFRNLRGIFVLQVAIWGALIAAAGTWGDRVAALFPGQSPRLGFYLQVAIAFSVFEVLLQLLSNTLQSFYETKRLAIAVVSGNILYLAVLVASLRAGFGIVGVLGASAATNLFISIALAPQAARLVAAVREGESPGAGAILRFSLPFVVTGILNQIVWRQSEVLFLGHFRGAPEAGYFGLAYRMPQLLLEFIPLTIYPLIMAGSSEAYAKDERNLPHAIELYYKLIYLLVVPIAALGFAFARPLVPILYGEEMLPAASLTQLFFVVFSYSFLYTPLSMALYVMGKSWINMLIFLLLAVLNVGLDLALIPRWGIWGAMIPVPIVLTSAIVLFRIATRRLRPDIRVPAGFVARCAAAGVPAAALAAASARWSSPAAIAAMIPVALLLLYAGFRLLRVVGAEEKELIRRLPIPAKERLIALF